MPRQAESYYSPDGDIAYIWIREADGVVRAREESWGLRALDERGALVGIEVWEASERLPRELVDALPRLEGHGVTIERQPA